MAKDYVIEVEGRFIDNITDSADEATESVKDLGKEAKKTKKEVDKLDKEKVSPKIDADTNKFVKKIRQAEEKARKFGKTKTAVMLTAVDKASSVITKVHNKAKKIAGKTWQGIVKAKDSASSILKKVSSLGKGIAGKTWSAIVKIKDYATAPLSKIKNALFSIKTLIGAIAAGWAANQLVLNPINIADAYSSAKISFSTLLGESQGQKMMDDLDAFAKATPFNTTNVISNAQKMLAMGWNAEDILKDMEILGNAAAATGKLDQGLESIVRAMSQIKTKGKLSTEELNQLAEAGIAAKAMLAEQLGYGTGDSGIAAMTEDLENGAIASDKAIAALLEGMKKYDGMMESMANETVEGLWSQMQDAFSINIARRWGQGLQDGAKKGFGTILDLLDSSEDALADVGDTVYDLGKTASNWLADKLEVAVKKIKEITGGDEFKNANLGGKIKLLWKGVIGNPLSNWWKETVIPWWDNTVVPWLEDKAKGLGKGLGRGLTAGITTLLGFDATGALEDGATIGGAFMEGFLEGFDTDKIGQALSNWVNENKGLAAIIGTIAGVKLLGGLGSLVGNIKGLFGGSSSGGIGGGTVGTMTVNAAVVNINSAIGGDTPDVDLPNIGKGAGGKAAGGAAGGGFWAWLSGLGTKAGAGIASLFGKVAAGTGVTATGTTATVIGGLETGGVLAGIIGAIDAGIDIFQGVKAGKAGDKKKAKDEYVTAGTKVGIMAGGAGAGAGIGAAIGAAGGPIGSAAGALLGLGIGALVSLIFGDKAGKAISDSTDEGGWLNNTGKAIKVFFTKTLPEKWNAFWDGASTFFEETVPYALKYASEKINTFFTETIPKKWNEFWTGVATFVTETVPYAIGYAVGKVYTFFTETLPEKWNAFWTAVGTFFTETLPQWASSVWNNNIVPFFTETLPQHWHAFWSATETFFKETIPQWAETIWNEQIVPFFTETLPGFFATLLEEVGTFFTETLPTLGAAIWAPIKTFFTETIPGWVNSALDAVSSFFGTIGENLVSGFKAGSDTKKARGGIVGGGSSSMEAFARGGIVGGSTRFIRVNEESPEMIIPLSSQRRERALKLWTRTGELLDVPGFARGGRTSGSNDEGIRFRTYGGSDSAGGRTVQINMGGVKFEIHVNGSGKESIIEAIKDQAGDLADYFVGLIADALETEFENTPVKGGVA